MKIVSWDVGIIHLAYCIMEKSDNKDIPYKIYEWKNINILEDKDVNICDGFFKKKKNDNETNSCNRNVKYHGIINNNDYYYCGIHKTQYDKVLSMNNLTDFIKSDCKTPCCHILKNKNKTCNKKSNWKYNFNGENKYLCTSHKKHFLNKEQKSRCLNKLKKMNATKAPIDFLKEKLIKILDQHPQLLNVDKVVIENQPSLKNPKMKSIANTLYCWFLIRGIIDKDKNNSTISNITFMSPSNKLKVESDNTIKILSRSKNETEKYKLTKKLGIIYCKQLIKNDNDNLTILEGHKKKDDLCDAFLQGAYYLTINN
jgi:hypothetical protein